MSRRQQDRVTIYEVAKRSGSSISTVSRVINGDPAVRQDNRERVLRAISELGFVPSGAARGLSRRSTGILGFVFLREEYHATRPEDPEWPGYLDVAMRAAEREAERSGYSLLLSGVRPGDEATVTALTGRVDGLMLMDEVLDEEALDRLAERFPAVWFAGRAGARTTVVRADQDAGVRALAEHLLDGPHRFTDVVAIVGPEAVSDHAARRRALEQVSAARDVRVRLWTVEPGSSGAAGAVATRLAAEPTPEVIICVNDEVAIGTVTALRERGLRVPADVAVTGFDDVWIARYVDPPLTTVRQPVTDLAAQAVRSLVRRLDGDSTDGPIVLPTQLVVRRSCGCVP
ncbi:LacI family DNA-binding transcriptional regulator [Pseudonocardia sp. NPDC049635]|uniref:LacI family DNA-binding transcriptional regulator n=1 Tax=Pseudonocardia sp. NPDC049635 TaxID=3155506 RepID=UPI0033D125E7